MCVELRDRTGQDRQLNRMTDHMAPGIKKNKKIKNSWNELFVSGIDLRRFIFRSWLGKLTNPAINK